MTTLEGKTAIVTGASSGIGAKIAEELAAEGVKVLLAARSEDKLKDVVEKIESKSMGKASYVVTDVSDLQSVTNLVKEAQKEFSQVDILINNAGQMLTGTVRSGRVKEWERMIDVNIKGLLYCIDAVLPEMIDRSYGHIVNISSVSGFEVTKNSTVYSATKSAV